MGDKQKLYTIIIIRKDGGDGQTLDLETGETYLFGRFQPSFSSLPFVYHIHPVQQPALPDSVEARVRHRYCGSTCQDYN